MSKTPQEASLAKLAWCITEGAKNANIELGGAIRGRLIASIARVMEADGVILMWSHDVDAALEKWLEAK
jgi:hypothetical protein